MGRDQSVNCPGPIVLWVVWSYIGHIPKESTLIYSPACLIADQSRVWVARDVDPDVDSMIQRQCGPSIGSPAWFVAARHARCYAHDLEKTT